MRVLDRVARAYEGGGGGDVGVKDLAAWTAASRAVGPVVPAMVLTSPGAAACRCWFKTRERASIPCMSLPGRYTIDIEYWLRWLAHRMRRSAVWALVVKMWPSD